MKHLLHIALATIIVLVGGLSAQEARADVDVYTTPGRHRVNGRDWRTTCEPYSVTTRCRTEILATTVTQHGGRFRSTTGWVFNNLTYLPSPRSVWAGNPLGADGQWKAADGRRWQTECDTPATGRNGCRSYAQAKVIVPTERGYAWKQTWIFNSMTRFSAARPSPEVTLADPRLNACVRETAGLRAGERLTLDKARQLKEVVCLSDGIASLRGVEQLTSLRTLEIYRGTVSDLSPLRGLTSLRELGLGGHRIADLRPLAGLTSLTYLNLAHNPVRDVSVVAGLPRLETLVLFTTRVTALDPIRSLPRLTTLEVGGNRGVDLAALRGNRSINALGLAGAGARDLSILKGLPLTVLDLRDNGLTSLSSMDAATATRVDVLDVSSNRLPDAGSLARFTSLGTLSVADNPIADAGPLASLTRLQSLQIDRTAIRDVTPLASLGSLRYLSAVGTPVQDWSPLGPLQGKGLDIVVTPPNGQRTREAIQTAGLSGA